MHHPSTIAAPRLRHALLGTVALVGLLAVGTAGAQLVLTGDADPDEARLQLLRGIEQLSQVLTDYDSRTQLTLASRAVMEDQHYQALKALRALLPREARLLAATPR